MTNITTLAANCRVSLPGGTIIETGGLAGSATQAATARPRLRSFRAGVGENEIHPRIQTALDELEIDEQETIFLDVELTSASRGLRAVGPVDQIIVEPSAPPAGSVQVVLYQDEAGGVSWHLPDDMHPGIPATSTGRLRRPRAAGAGARFTIPARTQAAKVPRTSGTGRRLRGQITSIGRKVLKVLVIPILSPLLATPLESIVGAIERKHRQELIRGLTLQNYRRRVSEPFADWKALAGKRSLLVIHGIFSTTEGVLSQFPEAAMNELAQHYGGRMIAFDQITVSRGPEENARFFLEQVQQAAPDDRFEFDVLCHSRGGIVARTLAERGTTLLPGHKCTFRKVFFVATPNHGSVLGDPDHMVDMIDTFTNIITSFPDGPVTYSLETVLAILKLLVYAAGTRLPGLAAMGTGSYITELNQSTVPSPAAYAAAAADFTPDPNADNGFITGRFANGAIDRIFKDGDTEVPNDLVVPFKGVFEGNGHPSFPLANPLLFDASAHVWHSGFFSRPETFAAMKRHFDLPASDSPVIEPLPFRTTRSITDDPVDFAPIAEPARPPRPRPRMRSGGKVSPEAVSAKNVFRDASASPSPVNNLIRESKRNAIQRDPHIDFHEQVREGESNVLTVRLEDLTGSKDQVKVLNIALGEGHTQVEIGVTLSAPGFDVEVLGEPRMIVKTVRDPALERVEFKLTARGLGGASGRREIIANFWMANSCIGAIGHRTVIVPPEGGSESDGSHFSSGFVIPPSRREDCDLAIGVQGDDEAGMPPFRITLRSEIAGQEYSDLYAGKLILNEPGTSLGAYLDQYYQRHFDAYPGDKLTDAQFDSALIKWRVQFSTGLSALGKKLWTFLPQRFRDEYFRLYHAGAEPKSILVHSDEMILPWELIVPHQVVDGKLEELPPLGQRHVLGRWKPGLRMKPQPQRLLVRKFFIINPKYHGDQELASAALEAQELHKLFPKSTPIAPANFAALSALLNQPDPGIFHFSGHGDYDPANSDLNTLLLEDNETLDALQITGSRLAAEGCPIVYLNACHVGNTGNVVGRMGGFGANFLQSGCSGVIAPYWPVDDDKATQFSLELYQQLAKGTPIGEVLRDLRVAHPDDPTYCAFSYFGDPWASLDLDGMK